MSRASRSFVLLAGGSVLAALLPAAALAQGTVGPSPPPAAPGEVPRVTEVREWSLVGTARQGRAIVVRYGSWGGCDSRPTATATETPTGVRITTTSTVPGPGDPVACAAVAYTGGTVTVPLRSPLGGRKLGGARRLPATPYSTLGFSADARPTVPAVRGLRVLDARRALCAAGFASRTGGPDRSGRATVRGTTPGAGTTVRRPAPATLSRRVQVGACTGAAWSGATRVVVRTEPR